MNREYKVGDKIYFAEEKRPYTVRACNKRFLVCTKPFNPKHTMQYTIVDLEKKIRGADNYWKWGGFNTYKTLEECNEILEGLMDGEVEISHRNYIQLNIVNK